MRNTAYPPPKDAGSIAVGKLALSPATRAAWRDNPLPIGEAIAHRIAQQQYWGPLLTRQQERGAILLTYQRAVVLVDKTGVRFRPRGDRPRDRWLIAARRLPPVERTSHV